MNITDRILVFLLLTDAVFGDGPLFNATWQLDLIELWLRGSVTDWGDFSPEGCKRSKFFASWIWPEYRPE